MGVKDLYTNSRYQYLYPEAAYGGWHQFAPYNELVKEYFCTDGKDIKHLKYMMKMTPMQIVIYVYMRPSSCRHWEVIPEVHITT